MAYAPGGGDMSPTSNCLSDLFRKIVWQKQTFFGVRTSDGACAAPEKLKLLEVVAGNTFTGAARGWVFSANIFTGTEMFLLKLSIHSCMQLIV